MKITVITPTLNSEKTILDTLDSVSSQTYQNIEHIIVDGGSNDRTLELAKKHKNKRIRIIKKKSNIYEAMNIGIKRSKGNIIGILSGDDIYQNSLVLKNVEKKFKSNQKIKMVIGSLVYFRGNNYNRKIRFYENKSFSYNLFKFGIMPPHPSTFIKKSVYMQNGLYDEKILIASDFNFFLRILFKKKINYAFLNKVLIRMRIGGVSTKNLLSSIKITNEIKYSLEKENINSFYLFILLRFFIKLKQFFFIPSKLDHDFKLNKKIQERLKERLHFKIVKSVNILVEKNKNFVLSALNLAFLGCFAVNLVKQYETLFHWPDGIFSKKFYPNHKKIPGRILLKEIKNSPNIKAIRVVGNLDIINKKYLKKKFLGKKIIHSPLPIISVENIKKYIPKIYVGELVFITLPTPKQEIMAEYLSEKYKNYKIICIGASISLASGFEKPVPTILYAMSLEWLWRLRSDTKRRIIRMFQTYRYYLIGCYKGSYKNLNFSEEK